MSIYIKDFLNINPYSRSGKLLKEIKAIIIHWTANPNSTSFQNRNYFDNRKYGKTGYGSAHYIIGLEGEILQCIPEEEMAYHVGSSQVDPKSGKIYTDKARGLFKEYASNPDTLSPNQVTIGIEMCVTDMEGHYTEATYESTIELCKDLCKKYKLNPMLQILTHNEVVGWKDCHRFFVNNPDKFLEFKEKVMEGI